MKAETACATRATSIVEPDASQTHPETNYDDVRAGIKRAIADYLRKQRTSNAQPVVYERRHGRTVRRG